MPPPVAEGSQSPSSYWPEDSLGPDGRPARTRTPAPALLVMVDLARAGRRRCGRGRRSTGGVRQVPVEPLASGTVDAVRRVEQLKRTRLRVAEAPGPVAAAGAAPTPISGAGPARGCEGAPRVVWYLTLRASRSPWHRRHGSSPDAPRPQRRVAAGRRQRMRRPGRQDPARRIPRGPPSTCGPRVTRRQRAARPH